MMLQLPNGIGLNVLEQFLIYLTSWPLMGECGDLGTVWHNKTIRGTEVPLMNGRFAPTDVAYELNNLVEMHWTF